MSGMCVIPRTSYWVFVTKYLHNWTALGVSLILSQTSQHQYDCVWRHHQVHWQTPKSEGVTQTLNMPVSRSRTVPVPSCSLATMQASHVRSSPKHSNTALPFLGQRESPIQMSHTSQRNMRDTRGHVIVWSKVCFIKAKCNERSLDLVLCGSSSLALIQRHMSSTIDVIAKFRGRWRTTNTRIRMSVDSIDNKQFWSGITFHADLYTLDFNISVYVQNSTIKTSQSEMAYFAPQSIQYAATRLSQFHVVMQYFIIVSPVRLWFRDYSDQRCAFFSVALCDPSLLINIRSTQLHCGGGGGLILAVYIMLLLGV